MLICYLNEEFISDLTKLGRCYGGKIYDNFQKNWTIEQFKKKKIYRIFIHIFKSHFGSKSTQWLHFGWISTQLCIFAVNFEFTWRFVLNLSVYLNIFNETIWVEMEVLHDFCDFPSEKIQKSIYSFRKYLFSWHSILIHSNTALCF